MTSHPFQLSGELEGFRREVRAMADRKFAPKAAYWDENEEFPEENWKFLAGQG